MFLKKHERLVYGKCNGKHHKGASCFKADKWLQFEKGRVQNMDILREDLRRLFRIKAHLQKRPKLTYALLLLFGIWAAYHIVSPWHYLSQEQLSNITNVYMNSRLQKLNMCMQQLLAGGQPQVVSLKDHNPAFYLYASYLGVLFGKTEAWQVFLLLQSGAAALVFLLYPVLIYKLTHSMLTACISPFLLKTFLGWILYEFKTDSYWSMAWIIVMGLPLLAVYFREKHGWPKWAAFTGICLCMGLANLPRMHSSLGILLLLLVAIVREQFTLFKERRNRKTVVLGCALLCISLISYSAFTGLIPKVYIAVTGQEGKIEDFGPWHSVYIGLGWEENKYSIEYRDEYANELVQSIDPTAEYCSPKYMEILKNEWFRLWREDPGYMIGSYFRKFKACVKLCLESPVYSHYDGGFYLNGIMLGLCLLRYIFKRRKILLPWSPLIFGTLFCGLFSLVFPMIAMPRFYYSLGSFAAYGMLLTFGILAVTRSVIRAAEDFSQKDPARIMGTDT